MGYLGTKPANQITDSTLIADGTVTTSDIADGAITTAKIAAGAVIQADLATGVTTTGPTFRAWASTNQSISAFSTTKILYNQEEWDTNNNFSSSRFTPTVAGYYFISAGTRTGNAGGSEFVNFITKNGTTYAHGSNCSATGINLSVVSTLVYMNGSTDYVEVNVYPGPNTCATQEGSAYVYFTGFLARAA